VRLTWFVLMVGVLRRLVLLLHNMCLHLVTRKGLEPLYSTIPLYTNLSICALSNRLEIRLNLWPHHHVNACGRLCFSYRLL
jgi:hypothetical protein